VQTTNTPGIVNITRVEVGDLAGNTRTYQPAELAAMGIATSATLVNMGAAPDVRVSAPQIVTEGASAAIIIEVDFLGVSTLRTTLTTRAMIRPEDGGGAPVALFSQSSVLAITQLPAGDYRERITIPLTNDQINRGVQIADIEIGATGRVFQGGASTTRVLVSVLDDDIAVVGTNDRDVMNGTLFADQLSGHDGNDILAGLRGNDTIDGGAGQDNAVFSGVRGEYTVASAGLLTTVTDRTPTRDGVDTLTSIERLRFADGTLALDIALPGQGGSNAGSAFRLYEAAFNRAPDNSGLAFWIKQLDGGLPVRSAAENFVISGEFQRVYGANPTADALVTGFYTNILGRAPEAAGYNYWFGILNNQPQNRALVLENIANSPENQNGLIATIGQGIWLPGDLLA
jgi:hypothetical protein